ncbi:MAG: UDP-N-acetylenolpyruvoylglucosamine reductase [Deltaproteobacteria bacterium RIFCSPHIGHO2_12_FULL_43_9]|nr:MAG: UDP-N-acetylenolpyruvoylglucosamine reductase [Deltaproteobacteria bacterium RIFCSPHIGHO2_12_FULL_43_9]
MINGIDKSLFAGFSGEVALNEPLSKHTSWRVGGPASAMVFPKEIGSLADLIKRLRSANIPYAVIGNGSNVLAPDEGYKGVVINLKHCFEQIEEFGKHSDSVLLKVGAGASKYKLLQYAMHHGLIDLIFLAGIPGTIGGGLAMNAGTSEGAFDAVTESVSLIDREGNLILLEKNSIKFGYRTGIRHGVIVECVLRSRIGPSEEMKERVNTFMTKRKETQPLTFPSCGSTFKNPKGDYAGRLIEAAGLKGFKIGDAQVSVLHANFIVNLGSASSKDINSLIAHVKKMVHQKFGVELSEEILRLEEI